MNRMAKQYFWSDLHLGHEKSLEYDNRPFKDLDHMHRVLINNYQSTVAKYSVCYFLADIGYKSAVRDIIPKMTHGTKVFIRGNHDKDMGDNFLYEAGFDVILNNATISVGKNIVTLSHFPLYGVYREDITGMKGAVNGENWHGESREKYLPFIVRDFGQFHLHGHIHSSPNNGKSKKILGRQYDVGVPGNNYRPVSISVIQSWIDRSLRDEKESV